MPHSVSATKSMRQAARRRLRNRSRHSALRNQLKRCETAITSGDQTAIAAELTRTLRALDRAASRKLIHRNTAARRKSRLTKMANCTQQQDQPV